jgi:hypothetical protein
MKLYLPHALLPFAFMLTACGLDGAYADKIPPYVGAPPEIVLTEDESKIIESGQPVYKQVQNASGGSGAVVFKVNASRDIIWSVISDFKHYPEWIGGKLEKTEIYKGQDATKTYVAFTLNLGFLMGRWTYHIEHTYSMKEEGWGTWKLDETKKNDLDDNIGFWNVKENLATGESIL